MGFLFRALLVLIAVSAVITVVRGVLLALVGPAQPAAVRNSRGGHLVKDPVCGTYIPQSTAFQARDQFFCSEECRSRFLAG